MLSGTTLSLYQIGIAIDAGRWPDQTGLDIFHVRDGQPRPGPQLGDVGRNIKPVCDRNADEIHDEMPFVRRSVPDKRFRFISNEPSTPTLWRETSSLI